MSDDRSYQYQGTDFPTLLEQIAKLDGNFRVFFVTSHPKDLDFSIIKLVKKYDKLCPYFHLPIQSGSDRLLKKMNRKYSRQRYLEIINEIRRQIPDAAITTDIIVGYPGETAADFEQTVDICQHVKYDLAYIARFSPRPQTTAAKVPDSVSAQQNLEFRRRLLDKKVAVLWESAEAGMAANGVKIFSRHQTPNTISTLPVKAVTRTQTLV